MEDNNTNTKNLIRLTSIVPRLSEELQAAIEEKAAEFFTQLTEDVGEFLTHDLDVNGQSEDDIRTLVQCVPEALEYTNNTYTDFIPLDYAACCPETVSFVPVLAEEGMKHHVRGEGMRGGLLFPSLFDERNVFLRVVFYSFKNPMIYIDVLKRLRKMGMFQKEDIAESSLLWECAGSIRRGALDYLAEWDPTALNGNGCLLHYASGCHQDANCVEMSAVLAVTLRHFPRELGLLLLEDHTTPCKKTTMKLARDNLGRERSWKIISKCLDETDLTKILELDKTTNMYPFMLAAAGDCSELDLLYYLTRRHPLALK